jgi:hypothetical protein
MTAALDLARELVRAPRPDLALSLGLLPDRLRSFSIPRPQQPFGRRTWTSLRCTRTMDLPLGSAAGAAPAWEWLGPCGLRGVRNIHDR